MNAISGLHALDNQLIKELQGTSAVEKVFFDHVSKLEGAHSPATADHALFPENGLFSGKTRPF